jgi:hypothetical protein
VKIGSHYCKYLVILFYINKTVLKNVYKEKYSLAPSSGKSILAAMPGNTMMNIHVYKEKYSLAPSSGKSILAAIPGNTMMNICIQGKVQSSSLIWEEYPGRHAQEHHDEHTCIQGKVQSSSLIWEEYPGHHAREHHG